MRISSFSPVVMFVHARLEHTSKTVKSLSECIYADSTELIIYSDGARNVKEQIEVDAVRSFLYSLNSFKSIKVIERDYNFGLAKNIFNGVSEVLTQYKKAIILEDDMEFNRLFLRYMNYNLIKYENDDYVWQISGWSPAVNNQIKPEEFFVYKSQLMPCWGWATWEKKWEKCITDPGQLLGEFTLKSKFSFNLGMRYPFFSHLIGNYMRANSTWAVFWYATAFINNGGSICPSRSMVRNIGSDGSGSHSPIAIEQGDVQYSVDIVNVEEQSGEEVLREIEKAYSKCLSIPQRLSMYVKVLLPTRFWSLMK